MLPQTQLAVGPTRVTLDPLLPVPLAHGVGPFPLELAVGNRSPRHERKGGSEDRFLLRRALILV